jgi:hypothetical protein
MRTVALIATLAAASLTTGCIQRADDHPIKQVLPTADAVAIKVPGQAMGATRGLGDIADYYRITRDVSRNLNGGAAWVLIVVHTIVQYPASDVSGNTYTWGPHSDALDPAEWRLVVIENADGTYDWSFDGRSKTEVGSSFETLINGHAVPGEVAHRGSGTFAIDFDAAERVNPIDNDARGQVAITYDLDNLDNTPATLSMSIDSVEPDENGVDQPVHFDYDYAENLDGSGDLQFAIHGDLDDDGSLFEDALIRSRWVSTGPGRADVMAQGGDLGELVVTASECWDQTFRRVYYTDSETWLPTEGDAGDCAFQDQDLPDSL